MAAEESTESFIISRIQSISHRIHGNSEWNLREVEKTTKSDFSQPTAVTEIFIKSHSEREYMCLVWWRSDNLKITSNFPHHAFDFQPRALAFLFPRWGRRSSTYARYASMLSSVKSLCKYFKLFSLSPPAAASQAFMLYTRQRGSRFLHI
jgi:hypothetical protein